MSREDWKFPSSAAFRYAFVGQVEVPKFGPIRRRELIAALRKLGFGGPYSGGKHEFMQRGTVVLTIPNPHGGDIGRGLLATILRQAGITRREWEEA